jgi:hypothetical protein
MTVRRASNAIPFVERLDLLRHDIEAVPSAKSRRSTPETRGLAAEIHDGAYFLRHEILEAEKALRLKAEGEAPEVHANERKVMFDRAAMLHARDERRAMLRELAAKARGESESRRAADALRELVFASREVEKRALSSAVR